MHIGKCCALREWIRYVRPDNIWIGDYVMIDDFVLICGGRDAMTEFKGYNHIGHFSSIVGSAGVVFEKFSSMAFGCRLLSESDDYVGGFMSNPMIPMEFHNQKVGRIVVQSHAIIGTNSVVLPGVTIGEGATIGACSLVAHDVEPWTVNIGVPTKPVKMRDRAGVLAMYEKFLKEYGR